MNKKILLLAVFVVITIFTISFISSQEYFAYGQDLDFKKSCTNETGGICTSSASCNVTIKYPQNNSYLANSQGMTNGGTGIFNYTISGSSLEKKGTYNWDMFCCDGSNCGESHGEFVITTNGESLSSDKVFVYLGMLAILVFLFVVDLGAISLLPAKNTYDDDGLLLDINKLKYVRAILWGISYILVMAITFTASTISFLYFENDLFGSLLFNIYKIMMLMILPMVIIWFLWIFYNIFQDKEMKNMLERGVPIGDRL